MVLNKGFFKKRYLRKNWNRTKIVATLGPASDSPGMITRLIEAGVDVFRLNFSHGTLLEHKIRIENIRRVSRKLNWPIAIIQDLPGPKVRVGELKEKVVNLKDGETLCLSVRKINPVRKFGSEILIPVTDSSFMSILDKGNYVYLNDGLIKLRVLGKGKAGVRCLIIHGGKLRAGKGINFPGGDYPGLNFNARDREYLSFGLNLGVDFVALSFIKTAEDILKVRKFIKKKNKKVKLIAKIEKREALENLNEIIDVSDAIMIARGDLGIEVPLEKIALVQKDIICRCNKSGKPVITATQMLESMVNNPSPTRAEVTDITNAILDGTDAVMLSEETAIGSYPQKAIQAMAKIAVETEKALPSKKILEMRPFLGKESSVAEAVSHAACLVASDLKVAAIITPTTSGSTARMVSRYRPSPPIIAITPEMNTWKELQLSWGIFPLKINRVKSIDDMLDKARVMAKRTELVKKGDKVVITSGAPVGITGTTNLLEVRDIF